jgi:hypothetical protein
MWMCLRGRIHEYPHPWIDPWISTCVGHVINLIARSLLFGKDLEALKEKLTQSDDIELWRKRGPLSKIHNIVTWIRALP